MPRRQVRLGLPSRVVGGLVDGDILHLHTVPMAQIPDCLLCGGKESLVWLTDCGALLHGVDVCWIPLRTGYP